MGKAENEWVVYLATCPLGKYYIGACHDFSKRKYNHKLNATNECPKYDLLHPKHKIEVYNGNTLIGVWDTPMECIQELGLDHTNIYRCLAGKRKTSKGYSFKYGKSLKSGGV